MTVARLLRNTPALYQGHSTLIPQTIKGQWPWLVEEIDGEGACLKLSNMRNEHLYWIAAADLDAIAIKPSALAL